MKHKNLIYFLNGSVGDFLMALFFMENVYKNDRSIKLFVITPRSKDIFTELSEKYPYITIIEANRKSFRGIASSLGLIRFIFAVNFVVTPPTPGVFPIRTKLVAKTLALYPGSFFIGFDDKRWGNFLYTRLLPYNQTILYIETIKSIVQELGFKVVQKEPHFSFAECPHVFKEHGLSKGKYLVFHPCGSDEKRSVKHPNLTWLLTHILEQYPNLTVVLSGSAADRSHIESALRGQSFGGRVLNLSGRVSMAELATLITHAALYVGVDTGISHLAAFLGVSSVVFSHSGTVSNWLPYYSNNTDVLFKVRHTEDHVYSDKKYLMKHCWGDICLDIPPREIVWENIRKRISHE